MKLWTPFSFQGRLRRLPFALTGLTILILWRLPEPVLTILLLYRVPVYGMAYMAVLVLLACLAWPLASAGARRLHDAGLSGWPGTIYFAHLALTLLTAFYNSVPGRYVAPWLFTVVSWLVTLATLGLILLPSQKGENKFGADPRQGAQPAADAF